MNGLPRAVPVILSSGPLLPGALVLGGRTGLRHAGGGDAGVGTKVATFLISS